MRPHGRATISAVRPRALAICQRCGFQYNHDQLQWQFEYGAQRLINLRILVCPTCVDKPQIQLRTILLPPDPVPIEYPVPEDYVSATNPLSGNAAAPIPSLQPFSAQIGSFQNIPAAFDSNINKPSAYSARTTVFDSTFGNYLGVNWTGYPRGTFPPNLDYPVRTHTLGSYTINAPNNAALNSSTYLIQGSNVGSSVFSQWTTLASGNFANTVGEIVTGTIASGARYQFHRVAFSGGSVLVTSAGIPITSSDGRPIVVTPVNSDTMAVAQVRFSVTDGSSS